MELKNLQTLKLPSSVNDAGLAEIGKLQSLQTLDLQFANVTVEGVKNLAALKNLKSLNLGYGKGMTDAALKELAPLKGLQSLRLSNCAKLTTSGMKHLAALKTLQGLDLGACARHRQEPAGIVRPEETEAAGTSPPPASRD